MYSTFFEIGGHVVESYYEEEFGPRPRTNPLIVQAKRKGVPAPLVRQASKEIAASTGIDAMKVSSAYGRARRARRALTIAAALAAADGPLPIGDAIAIGVLGSYAAYETVMAVGEVKEGVGY